MRTLTAAILALPLTLGSCAFARSTQNDPLDARLLARLEPGHTTAREAVELLGAPADVVQLGRRSVYRYEFVTTKRAALLLLVVGLYNQDSRSDRAWLFFDEQGILTHVGASLEAAEAEYAMPWEDVHDG